MATAGDTVYHDETDDKGAEGDVEALIGSKRTATLLTWLVLMVFGAFITLGWWHLLLPTVGNKWVVAAVTATLTLLAALSARQIGQYRADAKKEEQRRPWHFGWRPYTFLAVISALGTLNAAFVLFESRSILRQDIATVRDAYNTLRDSAHQTLPVKPHLEKVARVEALLKDLHEEIVNPNRGNYCGVGDAARAIIAKIALLIPGYTEMNGSGVIRPCGVNDARAELVYQSYARKAREMLVEDQEYVRANGPGRTRLLATIDLHHDDAQVALDQLEISATGIGSTDGLNLEALYVARSHYNADRKSYFSLIDREVPGIPAISVLQTDRVNSYASTVDLFVKRMTHHTTWFYLVIALSIDFVLIYLLTEFNVRFGGRRQSDDSEVSQEEARFETDPKFIWYQPSRLQ